MLFFEYVVMFNNQRIYLVWTHSWCFTSLRQVSFHTTNNHWRWGVLSSQINAIFKTGSTVFRPPETPASWSPRPDSTSLRLTCRRSCCASFSSFQFTFPFTSFRQTTKHQLLSCLLPASSTVLIGFLNGFCETSDLIPIYFKWNANNFKWTTNIFIWWPD